MIFANIRFQECINISKQEARSASAVSTKYQPSLLLRLNKMYDVITFEDIDQVLFGIHRTAWV